MNSGLRSIAIRNKMFFQNYKPFFTPIFKHSNSHSQLLINKKSVKNETFILNYVIHFAALFPNFVQRIYNVFPLK
jgi:hypothetical protein